MRIPIKAKEIEVRCPLCTNNDIKENGWGAFRCRKCNTEFNLSYIQGCQHKFEKANNKTEFEFIRCIYCGEDKEVD